MLVNGKPAAAHRYGYTPFSICLDGQLIVRKNEIAVNVDNSDMPNSRWYSGSGIYRPVNLYVGEATYIKHQGIKIDILSVSPAKIKVETDVEGSYDTVEITIIDKDNNEAAHTNGLEAEITIDNVFLWDADTPNLYICHEVVWK